MPVLSWLQRKKPSLPIIEHPVFGRLEATLLNGNGTYFWETSRDLVTPKGTIGIFFDAPVDGPTDAQVQLWRWIYQNQETLSKSAEPLVLNRLRDFQLESRLGDLVWSGVGLSPDGNSKSPWDMSFLLGAEQGAILTAYFVDGVPTTVSFDD